MKKKISKILLASLLVFGLASVSNATSCPVNMCNGENQEVKAMVDEYRQLISRLKEFKEQKKGAKDGIQLVKVQADKTKDKKKAEIKVLKELITDYKADITGVRADIIDLRAEWCQLPDNTPPGNNPVPEPATMLLLGAGIAGIAGVRLRKKNK